MSSIHQLKTSSSDEWLGPESHLPNLTRELRRRDRPVWGTALPLVAGALFVTGLALGSLATLLLNRSRRSL
jgi:hypothetical protein